MNRARFITAARLEFLAEVVYHNEAQPGLANASLQRLKRQLRALLHSRSRGLDR